MNRTFANDKDLIYFPVIDTSHVTSVSYPFDGSNLTYCLKLDTSNLTSLNGLFSNTKIMHCPALETSKSQSFEDMFYKCVNLRSVPEFDISGVNNGQLTENPLIKCINYYTGTNHDTMELMT